MALGQNAHERSVSVCTEVHEVQWKAQINSLDTDVADDTENSTAKEGIMANAYT